MLRIMLEEEKLNTPEEMLLNVVNQGPYNNITIPLLLCGLNIILGTEDPGTGKSSLFTGMFKPLGHDRHRNINGLFQWSTRLFEKTPSGEETIFDSRTVHCENTPLIIEDSCIVTNNIVYFPHSCDMLRIREDYSYYDHYRRTAEYCEGRPNVVVGHDYLFQEHLSGHN